MMLLLIFLGLFVEQVSMMLITLPIYMPLVQKYGVDPVWFGVMFLICMQLGLLLPPHGLLLMTMKGVAPPQVRMGHIFQAVLPYIAMSLLLLALVFFVPASPSGYLRCSCNGKIVQGRSREAEARDGEVFHGEAILAVTKALLQSGVSYVGGYQGAPVSHVMDVLNDARGILDGPRRARRDQRQRGRRRGDARRLDQLPDARRGRLQVHRRHQRRLRRALQPRLRRRQGRRDDRARRGLRRRRLDHPGAQPRLRHEVADLAARPAAQPAEDRRDGRAGLRALGASSTPVMLELRIRACHVQGSFRRRATRREALPRRLHRDPDFDYGRICLPPATYAQEKHKIDVRWPAAVVSYSEQTE
jgi:hypothetical protein